MVPASLLSLRIFLKNTFDNNPITARSLSRTYHIDGDQFERAYKDHLSCIREISQRQVRAVAKHLSHGKGSSHRGVIRGP